ncbi:signal recognition particle-docking protein FtsY [Roseovarius pelagicus]|uniref:Signal recognition particle receptor FtsY n=1 Tax=Roseovarius pelagicus TaxID=2980108 RepID=A0ABY6D6R9_9RHOB|nr:signal recognition particle-docking protein FtsY [Roseovarius pelagicus]UXX81839.1 signal recognition particle-docking protein FtsY [Roseovarius pelagicus]
MAFFKKLKDRLFKSSSKIEDGLDAIIEDGGTQDASDPPAEIDPKAEALATTLEGVTASEAQQAVDHLIASGAATEVPADDTAKPEPEEQPTPEPDTVPVPKPATVPEPKPDTVPTPKPATVPAPEPERVPDPKPDTIPVPKPTTPPGPRPAPAPPVEVPEPPQEVPPATPTEAPVPSGDPAPAPTPVEIPLDTLPKAEAPTKTGLLGRLLGRGDGKGVTRRALDDDMLEQLEELLITADMGVDTALRVTANLAEGRMGKRLSTQEIKELLAQEIARIMEPVARPLPLYSKTPQVVLVVGVNGSGKTTTIGKLASQFRAAGKKVVIAAGDTFRAAAVEQLQVWGDRAGVPVLTAPEGSDPASLAFDAMGQAQADGADLLMIDTAGRLQNRADLMEELSKIVRVIRKKDPSAPHNTLLVLDATTGQNALSQVATFQKLADVSGLVMTKLDGTAKGGVLVALADKFGLPIHAIGVGEQIDDLAPFDPEDFAAALTGIER